MTNVVNLLVFIHLIHSPLSPTRALTTKSEFPKTFVFIMYRETFLIQFFYFIFFYRAKGFERTRNFTRSIKITLRTPVTSSALRRTNRNLQQRFQSEFTNSRSQKCWTVKI